MENFLSKDSPLYQVSIFIFNNIFALVFSRTISNNSSVFGVKRDDFFVIYCVANESIKGSLIVLVQQRWSMKLEITKPPKINWVNIEKDD